MSKYSGYEKDWPQCEIESSNLNTLQKRVAWAIRDVSGANCECECWPGNCGCASMAVDRAKEFE